ncbi:hypothetical protein LCGC14_1241270 [marine sediment metagenome]|uniref:Uncharacterized protein n=1 Tax=marine sediment metagenome TaxID=412755 RepID=A0A0F9L9S3_9ZZZZ
MKIEDERIAQLEKELGWHTLIKAKLCQLGE